MSKKLGRKEKEKLLNKKPRLPVCKCYINEEGIRKWFCKSSFDGEFGFFGDTGDAELISFEKVEKLKQEYSWLEIFTT